MLSHDSINTINPWILTQRIYDRNSLNIIKMDFGYVYLWKILLWYQFSILYAKHFYVFNSYTNIWFQHRGLKPDKILPKCMYITFSTQMVYLHSTQVKNLLLKTLSNASVSIRRAGTILYNYTIIMPAFIILRFYLYSYFLI